MPKKEKKPLSPFMAELLSFRADPERLSELNANQVKDTSRETWHFPNRGYGSYFLFVVGISSYFMLRGQGAAHELVKNRSPLYRCRNVILGTVSAAFTLAALANLQKSPKPYRFTEM